MYQKKMYFPWYVQVVDFDGATLFNGEVSSREGVALQVLKDKHFEQWRQFSSPLF